MLSKIKTTANALAEARSLYNVLAVNNESLDEEDEDSLQASDQNNNNDTNNNINNHTNNSNDMNEIIASSNDDNNNNQGELIGAHQTRSGSKKGQGELLDIVEISRKRRLSRDSANSLSSFIRWSFNHIDPSMQLPRQRSTIVSKYELARNNIESPDEREDDQTSCNETDEWGSILRRQQEQQVKSYKNLSEKLIRQQMKLKSNGEKSNSNSLIQLKNQLSASSMLSEGRPEKRTRSEAFPALLDDYPSQPPRKSSNYLGNVVDRLHIHQQQQQRHQHQQNNQRQPESSTNANNLNGLPSQLHHFLQQQQRQQQEQLQLRDSIEDLSASGINSTSNQQLAIANAIQRALLDSIQANGGLKPSVGSQDGATDLVTQPRAITAALNGSSANGDLQQQLSALIEVDSGRQQQQQQQQHRRSYNTRAASAGFNGNLTQYQRLLASAATAAAHRVEHQQHRHAQAAAALSALAASTESQRVGAMQVNGVNSFTNLSLNHHNHPFGHQIGMNIDFKCDICPSSFDDRHRLMQHQSIHLDLKKEWFAETPVDAVMKIFNRRRGEFLCNICNLRFEATLDYDQHNHERHGPRPYCCQFCGNGTRTFKCWRQYLNHLYDHRYIFSCTIDNCDFTVNRRDSLRFHIFRFHLNCQLPQQQKQQHQQQQQSQSQHKQYRSSSNGSNNNNNKSNINIIDTSANSNVKNIQTTNDTNTPSTIDVELDDSESDNQLDDNDDQRDQEQDSDELDADSKWPQLNVDESFNGTNKDESGEVDEDDNVNEEEDDVEQVNDNDEDVDEDDDEVRSEQSEMNVAD